MNAREGALFAEPFNSMNPFHCVPFLQLDDGTVIAESMSICSYLDELHPEPALFGRTPVERAVIDMWLRRFELDGFIPLLHALRNHVPTFAGTVALSTGSNEGRSGFCTPTYMAAKHGFKSVFDLATPGAQKLFDSDGDGRGEIWVGAAGWASTNVHRVKVRDYGIAPFLAPATEDETVFYSRLKDLIAEKKGVFYCYKPHYVHALYDVVLLEEPKHDPAKYKIVQPNQDADRFKKSRILTGDRVKTIRVAHSRSSGRFSTSCSPCRVSST